MLSSTRLPASLGSRSIPKSCCWSGRMARAVSNPGFPEPTSNLHEFPKETTTTAPIASPSPHLTRSLIHNVGPYHAPIRPAPVAHRHPASRRFQHLRGRRLWSQQGQAGRPGGCQQGPGDRQQGTGGSFARSELCWREAQQRWLCAEQELGWHRWQDWTVDQLRQQYVHAIIGALAKSLTELQAWFLLQSTTDALLVSSASWPCRAATWHLRKIHAI